jgi:hypothetical protein
MVYKIFIFSSATIVISFLIMKIIEFTCVEGWEDESGFHLGRKGGNRDDLLP